MPKLRCDHSESLHGRCVACGMTWDAQASVRERLHLQNDGDHAYRVFLGKRQIGFVSRAGHLPSCYRWWSHDIYGTRSGPSKRTSRDAVAQLIAFIEQDAS